MLGTHGRTGLDRLVMGSVAEDVLRRAGVPVLIVRATADAPSSDNPSLLAQRLSEA